jgi:hypothetical protein
VPGALAGQTEKSINMKQILIVGLLLGSSVVGCSGSNAAFDDAAGSAHLRLEVACSSNSDCPAAFECEAETEHGVTSTFCSSIDTVLPDGSGAKCPAGYEIEKEHGVSFCKPHGSDGAKHDGSDDGAGGSSDDRAGHDATDDRGAGGSGSDDAAGHDGADDRGAGGSGSDDAAGHDAADDQAAGGNDDGADDSGHGKGGK